MTDTPLIFVELPTFNGKEISIQAATITAIEQDPVNRKRAIIHTVGPAPHAITFPIDHDLETEDARREVLAVLGDAFLRAVAIQIPPADHDDIDTMSTGDFLRNIGGIE